MKSPCFCPGMWGLWAEFKAFQFENRRTGWDERSSWGRGVLALSHDPTNSADDQSQYTVSYTMSKAFLPLLGSGVNFRKAYYKGCWGHALEEALASWPPSPSSLHPVCIGLSNSAPAFILRHKDLYCCRPKRSGHAGNLPKSLIQANRFSSETEDLGHFIQKTYSYQLLFKCSNIALLNCL